MKTIVTTLIVTCFIFSTYAQQQKPVKSYNISLIKGNWDVYGFQKEFSFVNFQLKNDSFTVRYLNTVDTIFWQTSINKDTAQSFIKKLKSFNLDKKDIQNTATSQTIQGNSLSITIDKKTEKHIFTTPFTDSVPLKSCVNWLLTYAKQNSKTKAKTAFLEYACTDFDVSQSNQYIAEFINSQSYKSEKPLLSCLTKTKDWNIRHGILKALCKFVNNRSKEALATLLDQNLESPHEEMIVDALMCQYNDDYTKNLLLKAMQTNNTFLREKIMRFLAIQSVPEVKSEVLAYIQRTFSENDTSIKANSYYEITLRIADKELVRDLISLYQQHKSTHSPVLKELMHAIECNIECYRNIHNEYTFPDYPFNFNEAIKRLDEKIVEYLKK